MNKLTIYKNIRQHNCYECAFKNGRIFVHDNSGLWLSDLSKIPFKNRKEYEIRYVQVQYCDSGIYKRVFPTYSSSIDLKYAGKLLEYGFVSVIIITEETRNKILKIYNTEPFQDYGNSDFDNLGKLSQDENITHFIANIETEIDECIINVSFESKA